MPSLVEGSAPPVYQIGSSDTNPCTMQRYLELTGLYKRRQVFEGKKTSLFDLVTSRFEARGMKKNSLGAKGTWSVSASKQLD